MLLTDRKVDVTEIHGHEYFKYWPKWLQSLSKNDAPSARFREFTAVLKGYCLCLAYDIEYRQELSILVNIGCDVRYNSDTNLGHDRSSGGPDDLHAATHFRRLVWTKGFLLSSMR